MAAQSGPTAGDRRAPAWRATQLGAAFAAIDDPTVKLTDRRWWATQTPERLAKSAALLGVHPELPVPDAEAIAFRLELPRLMLRQAADAYAHARGRAARGRVLGRRRPGPGAVTRELGAGGGGSLGVIEDPPAIGRGEAGIRHV